MSEKRSLISLSLNDGLRQGADIGFSLVITIEKALADTLREWLKKSATSLDISTRIHRTYRSRLMLTQNVGINLCGFYIIMPQ